MPYSRPTLTELQQQVLQDINSAQITDASGNVLMGLLQQAILLVIANATAGMSYEHYGFIDWISLQAVPWTATDEYLEAWASLKGILRLAATATIGTATFASIGSNETTIPAGTAITRSDGTDFVTTADATVEGGSVTVTMQAVNTGSAGNFTAGTIFLLSSPLSGIQAQSTASAQVTAGTDQELDPALRTRMLQAFANPSQGGARADYITWALAVPGITRAWVTPLGMGAGTVVVYIMLDIAEAENDGFPVGTNGVSSTDDRATAATGDQLTAANAIVSKQPVTALVFVCAPTPQPVAFTVSGLGMNNNATMQASIQAALSDMFDRLGQTGGTIDPQTGLAWTGIEPSDWYASLEAIPGLSEFTIPVPAAPILPATGALFTLGACTFQT
jgi:uncharacterized phage protein gp47/JayE